MHLDKGYKMRDTIWSALQNKSLFAIRKLILKLAWRQVDTIIKIIYHIYLKYLDRQPEQYKQGPHCLPLIQQFLHTSTGRKMDIQSLGQA